MKKIRSKRQKIIYCVIIAWIFFGVFGILKKTDLSQLALYFASLTGFVGAYIWGETKRPSRSDDGDKYSS